MKYLQKLWVTCLITGRWSWLVRIILFIIVIRWGVCTVYAIPSASMEPTLHGDDAFWKKDRVVVNKLAFGPMIPFTHTRLFKTGSPKRLDIVVLVNPWNSDGPPLIKRVVGMPGEHILINQRNLYINDEKFKIPQDLTSVVNWASAVQAADWEVDRQILIVSKSIEYFEQVYGGFRKENEVVDIALNEYRRISGSIKDLVLEGMTPEEYTTAVDRLDVKIEAHYLCRFMIFKGVNSGEDSQFGVGKGDKLAVVPEGHYYLLGDNGDDSFDSRYLGWISEEKMIGRAFGIVTPFNRMRDLSGFLNTVWGKFWLVIFIGLLLAYELIPYYVGRPYRLQYQHAKKRYIVQWAWLSHSSLGIRLPFRLGWWKFTADSLVRGSLVAVYDIHSRKRHFVGRLLSLDEQRLTAKVAKLDTQTTTEIDVRDVVGLMKPLWYPFGQTTIEVDCTHE